MVENNPNDKGSVDELKKSFESLSKPVDKILDAIGSMYDEADKLNNAFLQGRTRLDEMNDAVAKAAAGVIRLGGDISSVSATMEGIAEGARRNVIATEDQVSKLYAASTILGTTSSSLVEKFAEKRKQLKAEGRWDELDLLPRNSSPIRLHNRCQLTGRPKGYIRQFGLCRVKFREMALDGKIPGITKASW